MKAQAKRSSAANFDGSGIPGSAAGRRSIATRAFSRDADGGGASSHRSSRVGLLALAIAAFVLLALAPLASASKNVQFYIGNPGSSPSGAALDGGLFSTPRGVAVNVAGTGGASAGDIYVVNGSGNRIEQFSASGAFIRAFGRDVIEEGKPNNNATGFEICDTTAGNVAADCKAGVTSPAEGGTLSSAQGLAINQTTGHLYVTNQSLIRVDEFDATGHFVRAFGQDVVSAGPGNVTPATAKQTLTVDATEGQFKLTFRGQTTADLAFNATSAEVQTALQALTTVGVGNATVSGGPGGAGGGTPYVITFAGALNNAPMAPITTSAGTTPLGGGAGASVVNTTTGATAYEICTAPADTCKTGTTGSVAGALKSTFNGQLAVAPVGAPNAGNVIVADPANLRVNEYTSSGSFVRSFGYDVANSPPNATTTFETCDASNFDVCKIGVTGPGVGQFATNAVNRVAVDSTGAIYTVEPTVNFRVQKFTPAGPTLTPSVFAAATLTGTSSSGSSQNNSLDVAIGASNRVFVTKVFPEDTGTPPATNAERRVLELDSSGTLLDTHIAEGQINSTTALAANPSNGRVYVSSSTTPNRVYVLADEGPLAATIAATDGIGSTGATLHGSVNPGGVLGTYHFEYVTDTQFQIDGWASADTTPNTDAGNGNVPANVSQAIAGLDPNRLYHVRLILEQTFGAATATTIDTFGDFITDTEAPSVTAPSVAGITGTTATLFGRVNPNSEDTTYFFEWGTTNGYGNTTPVEEAGEGPDEIVASAALTGLSLNTTYHFRLVASNPTGTTTSPDQTFTTALSDCTNGDFRQGSGALLPDCRAYEQVSPPDKNSLDVSDNTAPVLVTGDAVLFSSAGAFAGYPTGGGALGAGNFYYASRTGSDWSTVPSSPRPTHSSRARQIFGVSEDASRSLIFTYEHGFVPDPPPTEGTSNFYIHDNALHSTSLLVNTHVTTGISFAGSADLEHVGLTTSTVLVGDPGVPVEASKVYDLTEGSTALVSREPGTDLPFTTDAALAGYSSGGATFNGSSPSGAGAVSSDGEKIYFETPATTFGGPNSDTSLIYRRSGGATELASPSQRTTVDPLGPKRKIFRRATPDGSQLFFTSAELLTDDANTGPARAGSDLYRYDMDTDELLDLSATPGGDGARVQGVVGTSADGSLVYYVALGEVVSGGTAGQPNLYLWEDDGSASGVTRFVATLDSGDAANWATSQNFKQSRVTSDGRYVMLTSKASLTGYPNAGTAQIYRYDVEGAGGSGDLVCVSCNPTGEPSTSSSSVPVGVGSPRVLSEDGRYVLFNTSEALVARDTNEVEDAYIWSDGSIGLLSSGKSPSVSSVLGASADGTRAFFLTREKLVPQDSDHNVDVYVAAVNGGLLSQQELQFPSCAGEGCRDAGSAGPDAQPPLTPSFEGQGNVGKKICGKGKRKVRAKNGQSRCVKRPARKHRKSKQKASKTGRTSR